MTISPGTKPRLPSHYYVLYEPPDSVGDEALIFVSKRRRIAIKGTLFREFLRSVVPMLDGRNTVAEIQAAAADLFPANEVTSALELLARHHLLAEDEGVAPLAPQLNFFHELNESSSAMQERLAKATVTIVGLGGAGSLVAAHFAATGIRSLWLLDSSRVVETDSYFDPVFQNSDCGSPRAVVVAHALESRFPHLHITTNDQAAQSEEALVTAIAGSDLVVCCLDRGEASSLYKLNRACMAARIPWISCAVSGFEIVIGPAVRPSETPCYLCYTMRSVACTDRPEDAFGFQRFLDHRNRDDGSRRENLVFTAGLAANLLGLEAMKLLTGFAPSAITGAILVLDVMDMTMKKHTILQHPRCPVCFTAKTADEKMEATAAVG